jgi:hypothetical protein
MKYLIELRKQGTLDYVPEKGQVLWFVADSMKRYEVVLYYEIYLLNRGTLKLWEK